MCFKLKTGSAPVNLTEEDWNALGEATEGYTGSDCAVAVRDALYAPVRKC